MLVAPAITPVNVKLALVCPSGTVIDVGTFAVALFALVSVTSKPPTGAGSDKISGTDRLKPGATNAPVGRLIETGRTLTKVLPVVNSLAVAVIEAVPNAFVAKVKVAELEPLGIIKEAGTVAIPLSLLLKITLSPESPAGTLEVIATDAERSTPKFN